MNQNMDESNYNDNWIEEAKQNFDEALADQDWNTCRAVLADMEENNFSAKTYELRRQLNTAMSKNTDYDGAEHAQKEAEVRESRHDANLSSYAGY